MGTGALRDLAGEWQLAVDLPGAADVRGHVLFEVVGEVLVQRTTVPVPEAPDSCCVVVTEPDGTYVQHYFDSRGAARLYAMTFDGRIWTAGTDQAGFLSAGFPPTLRRQHQRRRHNHRRGVAELQRRQAVDA